IVSRRRGVSGTLVVVTHGLVCRALVERHALLPEGVVVTERFDNAGITVLHEDAPHGGSLVNCTRHLVTSLEMDRDGGAAQPPGNARGALVDPGRRRPGSNWRSLAGGRRATGDRPRAPRSSRSCALPEIARG